MKMLFNYFMYLFVALLTLSSGLHYNASSTKNIYDGFYLYIPKIELYNKIYNYNDVNNNVDRNVYLVRDYDLNRLNGSIILAAHSGNSSVSFFNNLDQLDLKDEVFLDDNANIYTYVIDNKYTIFKDGSFRFDDKNKYIYLITCLRNSPKKQLVYSGKLVKITKKSTFS